MLELKGELVFKTVAYHRAADAIGRSPVDLVSAYRAGDPPRIPGVGKAISDKIAELATTGRMAFYERLRAEVPPSLVELLQIPGLGPKTVRQLHAELGHRDSSTTCGAAAEGGRLRGLRGHVGADRGARPRGHRPARRRAPAGCGSTGPRSSSRPTDRRRWRRRPACARSSRPARSGGARSRSATSTCWPRPTTRPRSSSGLHRARRWSSRVVNRGGYKAAVRLMRGPQVDLMVMPPGEAGTYRIHFTGSKEHNVRLRAMARDQGWSLSEKGFLRIGEDGEPLTGDAAELRTFATEAEAYAFLGLPFIEPELREDARRDRGGAGRPAAGAHHARPTCAATCTATRTGPTGTSRSRSWPRPPARRGYAYQVLTDHSQSLAIARGLTPDRVAEQARDHRRAERAVRRRGGGGHARPPATPPEGFRLLHGCELEIRADGQLDFEDDLLARFDLVVASRPRRSPPDAGGADPADAQRHPQPARRRHRPSVRPQDRRRATTSTSTGTRSTRRPRGPARRSR